MKVCVPGHGKIILTKPELENSDGSFCNGGFEIQIPGFKANPACPEEGQIWIEYREGKIAVHIWNGKIDPTTVYIGKKGKSK